MFEELCPSPPSMNFWAAGLSPSCRGLELEGGCQSAESTSLECDRKHYAGTEILRPTHTHTHTRGNVICHLPVVNNTNHHNNNNDDVDERFCLGAPLFRWSEGTTNLGKKLLIQLRLDRLSPSDTKELFQPPSRFPKS